MSLPLVLFLFAVITPLFFAKTSSAPAWLGAQALALACVSYPALAHHGEGSTHAIVSMFELIMIRGCFVPLFIANVVRARTDAPADLMPSNLFTWAFALALIVLAFEFVEAAPGSEHGFAIGIMSATLMCGLLMLATTESAVAQLVAILFIENGIALFESTFSEPWPLPVHATLVGIYVLTAVVGAWLLPTDEVDVADADAPREVL